MIRGTWESGCVTVKGKVLNLADSLKVRNHSPTGFMWGYGGSGPAQLALALLMVFRGREFAEQHYQDFKWDVIAKLPQEDFAIPATDVTNWIRYRENQPWEGE